MRIAGDMLRGRALLLDGSRDSRRDVRDALDRGADLLIASTDSRVAVCMLAIWLPISSVALAVCVASVFTSAATTAKPLPASPARAASIVALSASRLVCSAIAVISLTTSPMRPAACSSSLTR
jgi:hypothetical protein